jgi:SAM-dependent methyltransferase
MHCPACTAAESRLHDRGPLPDFSRFAGTDVGRTLPGGRLVECTRCALWFRAPSPADADLARLYAACDAGDWDDEEVTDRADWSRIAATVRDRVPPGAPILDVGCWSGRLLERLGDYECYGVEPSRAARERAGDRGVRLLGPRLDAVPATGSFAAVICTDVVEHVTRPLEFVRDAASRLVPGGLLLVASGDTAAPTFRLRGSRYWYCALGEHVSFVSEAWMRWAAPRAGLEIDDVYRYRHERFRLDRWLRQAGLNAIDQALPGTLARVRARLGKDPFMHVGWAQARDHLLVVLRKRPTA